MFKLYIFPIILLLFSVVFPLYLKGNEKKAKKIINVILSILFRYLLPVLLLISNYINPSEEPLDESYIYTVVILSSVLMLNIVIDIIMFIFTKQFEIIKNNWEVTKMHSDLHEKTLSVLKKQTEVLDRK